MKSGPVNFETELKGMSVLDIATGEKIGSVSDIIINPTEGKVLGLAIIRSDKEVRAVSADQIQIGADAVMMADRAMEALDYSGRFAQAVPARDLLGSNVVTQDGRLVGSIRSIHLAPVELNLYYRVAASTLQSVFGRGFYISGDLPTAFSRDGKRMIVPPDVETTHARKSLSEFTDSGGVK